MFTELTPHRRSRSAVLAALALAGAALLAGCGDDTKAAEPPTTTVAHTDHPTTTAASTTAPVTTSPVTTGPSSSAPVTTAAAPDTAAPETTEPAADTTPDEAPSQIEVVTTDYSFELSSDVVAAGPVTFSLVNAGAEPHQMQVAALPEGVTAESFVETFRTEGEAVAFTQVVWTGGVNGVEPGATEVATANLQPGRYVVLCFIPTPGEHGTSHVEMGMVDELEVVDTETAAPEPPAVATIELSDYAIAIPERFTGGVTEVLNNGSENHEVILMRFHEGKSLADLVDWSQSGMPAERPFDYVGGVGTLAPGRRGWATLTMEPGDYVALCVIRNPEGHAHVDLGMITPFTVS